MIHIFNMLLGTAPKVLNILGKSVMPAAVTALGVNNAGTILPPEQLTDSIQFTNDPWVDGLAIASILARFAYVKLRDKKAKK